MAKSIFNVLSSLYTEYNLDNNYAAYEIRLQVNKTNPSEVILCWDNYDYGFSATSVTIDPASLPNWIIRLLHKYEFLWAAECSNEEGFCNEAGVYVQTQTESGYKLLEW